MSSLFNSQPIALFSADTQDTRESLSGDCACPTWIEPKSTTPRQKYQADVMLMQQPETVVMPLDAEHLILFTPTRAHGLAVLNTSATSLWRKFDQPQKQKDILAHTLPLSDKLHDLTLIEALWHHGFLTEPQTLTTATAGLPPQDTLVAWLHVTNACNLRCTYCYLNKTEDRMEADTARQAIEAIFRAARLHGYKNVKLKYAGGEALLNFNQVIAMHTQAQELATHADIQLQGLILTNGVTLNERHLTSLVQHNLQLMLSLDGVGASHDAQRTFANGQGSFALVERGINAAVKHGLVPQISITVTRKNIDSLASTLEWLLERDLPFSINFYRDNDASVSPADLRYDEQKMIAGMRTAFAIVEKLMPRRSYLSALIDRANLAAPHERTCSAGQDYLVIDHLGGIAKCQMQIEIPITNIYATDPLALIRSDQIALQNISVEEKEGCRSCDWKHWCAGGCPAETYRATGRYDVKSPHCNIYKALFPEVLRLEALRLLKYPPQALPQAQ